MNNSETNQEISQEQLKILEEISSQPTKGFESEMEQEADFEIAVSNLTSQIRGRFTGQALTESAQADVEAVVLIVSEIADRIRRFVLRLEGPRKEKLKELAAQGIDKVCPWLKHQGICGIGGFNPSPSFRSCNLAFPVICKALYGWLKRFLGI